MTYFEHNKYGTITKQPCHKCGAVREQDYMHRVEVQPHDIQFECDEHIDFADETSAPLDRGVIPAGIDFCEPYAKPAWPSPEDVLAGCGVVFIVLIIGAILEGIQ